MELFNFLAVGVTCGDGVEIGGTIVSIIRIIYNAIKIGVPVILIIIGMVDMGKAVAAQKEDEIKKAQSLLLKKAVAAVLVFLMFQLVQILMSVVGQKNTSNWACVDIILNEPTEGGTCKIDGESTGTWKIEGSGDNQYWDCSNG